MACSVLHRSRIVAIDVLLCFNFAVIFNFNALPYLPSKEQFLSGLLLWIYSSYATGKKFRNTQIFSKNYFCCMQALTEKKQVQQVD